MKKSIAKIMVSRAKRRFVILQALLALAFGCKPESSEPTGGETHFLTRCEAGTNACGDRLKCLCGVCTLPCAERAMCDALPSAECVPGCVTGDALAPGVCEVSCVAEA